MQIAGVRRSETMVTKSVEKLQHSLKLECREAGMPYLWPEQISSALKRSALRTAQRLAPRVSVVIPTRNREATIGEAILAGLEQVVRPLEIIVVDDGSTDGTADLIRERFGLELRSNAVRLITTSGRGQGAARNRGLLEASGSVLAYLDSDNTWHPEHLMWGLAAGIGNESFGFAYTGVRVTNLDSGQTLILAEPYDRGVLLRQNYIDTSSMLHTSNTLDLAGNWDNRLKRLIDWDFALRNTRLVPGRLVPVVTVNMNLDPALGNVSLTESLQVDVDIIWDTHARELETRGIRDVNYARFRRTPAESSRAYRGVVAETDKRRKVDPLVHVVIEDAAHQREIELRLITEGLSEVLTPYLNFVRQGSVAFEGQLETHPSGMGGSPVFWAPPRRLDRLDALAFTHGLLAAISGDSDVIVVGTRSDNSGLVKLGNVKSYTFYSATGFSAALGQRRIRRTLNGRFVDVTGLANLGGVAANLEDWFYGFGELKWNVSSDLPSEDLDFLSLPRQLHNPRPLRLGAVERPVVLVIGVHAAVGGVERNATEVIRRLRDDFDFMYIQTEPELGPDRPTAAALREAGATFIDLSAIADERRHIVALAHIRMLYGCSAVWLTNGSNWLSRNASSVRALFSDSVILDQEYYDDVHGWIEFVGQSGAKSFDVFPACNSKIRARLIDREGLPPNRVPLIFPALNEDQIKRALISNPTETRTELGLSHSTRLVAQVGRLVDQKRPIDFLELARRHRDRQDLHFLLVGQGPLEQECHDFVLRYELTNVSLIRHHEDVPTLLLCLDALMLCSAYEGLPLVVLESLAVGTPVVSTAVGDVPWCLSLLGTGIVVDNSAEALESLDLDEIWHRVSQQRKKLKAQRQLVLTQFGVSRAAEKYAQNFRGEFFGEDRS